MIKKAKVFTLLGIKTMSSLYLTVLLFAHQCSPRKQ